MSFINCPECNTEISVKNSICVKCGYQISESEIKLKKNTKEEYVNQQQKAAYIAITFGFLFILYAFLFSAEPVIAISLGTGCIGSGILIFTYIYFFQNFMYKDYLK